MKNENKELTEHVEKTKQRETRTLLKECSVTYSLTLRPLGSGHKTFWKESTGMLKLAFHFVKKVIHLCTHLFCGSLMKQHQ